LDLLASLALTTQWMHPVAAKQGPVSKHSAVSPVHVTCPISFEPSGMIVLPSCLMGSTVCALTASPGLNFFESIEDVILARMAEPAGNGEIACGLATAGAFESSCEFALLCAAALPTQKIPATIKIPDRIITNLLPIILYVEFARESWRREDSRKRMAKINGKQKKQLAL
jgi:hypothetical protein